MHRHPRCRSSGTRSFAHHSQKLIPRIGEATPDDQSVLGHLLLIAGKVAKQEGLDKGFRVVINNGEEGGETVPHLHVHLLAGRQLGWPPS